MESNPTLPLFVVGTFRSSSKDGTCPATEALLTLLRFQTGLIAVPVVKLDASDEAISCMKDSVLFGPDTVFSFFHMVWQQRDCM